MLTLLLIINIFKALLMFYFMNICMLRLAHMKYMYNILYTQQSLKYSQQTLYYCIYGDSQFTEKGPYVYTWLANYMYITFSH